MSMPNSKSVQLRWQPLDEWLAATPIVQPRVKRAFVSCCDADGQAVDRCSREA